MIIVHKVYVGRLGKNLRFAFTSILFLISCGEDEPLIEQPSCLKGVSRLSATVTETRLGPSDFTSGPCDMSVTRFPGMSEASDSIIVDAIFGYSTGVQIRLYNVQFKGEYKVGIDSGPGEPYAICKFSHTTYGFDAFHDYSTDPNGLGSITIDSVSSFYIEGTFKATLFSGDSLQEAHLNGKFRGI